MNRKGKSRETRGRIHGRPGAGERMRRRRRKRLTARLLVAAAILLVCAGAAGPLLVLSGFGRQARIQIAAPDQEVYVGEEQPPLFA